MAVDYWHDVSILFGGIQLGGNAKNFMVGCDVATLDTTPISTTGWVECIGGNKSGTFSMDFMQDVAAAAADSVVWPLLGTVDTPLSVITPSADGSLAYFARTLPLSYTPIQGNAGDLAMATVSGASSTGPVVRGTLMHPTTTARTSSSTGTARQLGAVSATQRVYAALHVLSVSGTTPSLTVVVQSDDNSGMTTPTSRISFSAANSVSSQFGSAAGAITDDWWRVSWTISGTTPSFLFGVTVGII